MENRFPTYNSKAEYDAEKDSLPIPYVATYPSETDGKTVVVYADGTSRPLDTSKYILSSTGYSGTVLVPKPKS